MKTFTTVSIWYLVEDKLPPKDVDVLVQIFSSLIKETFVSSLYLRNGFWYYTECGDEIRSDEKVICWTEIPEPNTQVPDKNT